MGRDNLSVRTGLFIGGEFVDALDGRTLPTLNPHDGSTLADVAEAGPADIDRAADAARSAFPAWRDTPAAERGHLLLKLADAIEADAAELARLESLDTGHPINDSTKLDVPRTAATFRYFGGMADKLQGTVVPVERGFLNYVLREPVGVVGQIVPWNFPLMFTSWKMGPALAAGNTVVLKPAELTPLSSLRVAELMAEVGFPPGVVNIVPGFGARAGAHLAGHRGIDKIAFTGSTGVGRRIVEASAGNLKRVQLELGGKGANIVFDDADLVAAVGGSAFAIFHNQGQACIAGSRLLLHEAIADEFLDRFLALARSIRVGDPLDPATEMGPLTSAEHRDRVLSYVKVALDEGGEVITGGNAPADPALGRGFYVEPTVVRAQPTDRVCLEEVFGTRRRWSPWPTAPTTAWGVACGRGVCPGATGWRAPSGPGWCGSTPTKGRTRVRRSAAWASRGTAVRWASRPCTSTPMPSPSGSTSTPTSRRGTTAAEITSLRRER